MEGKVIGENNLKGYLVIEVARHKMCVCRTQLFKLILDMLLYIASKL